MASTSYIVAATASRPAKQIRNLKSAKREADVRAELDGVSVEVRTAATDRLTYTATAPAAPAPQVKTITITPEAVMQAATRAAKKTSAKKAPAKKAGETVAKKVARKQAAIANAKGARRETQGGSAVSGWELLYDKPRQAAQVVRRFNSDGNLEYALVCTSHQEIVQLKRLVDERALRRDGDWCPSCTA